MRVLAHVTFDSPEFVPDAARGDVTFLGRPPRSRDSVNRYHRWYAYAFWVRALKHLRVHAEPSDRLIIASPAALWFLPLLVAVPIRRERAFYGPIGAEPVDVTLCDSWPMMALMTLRNWIFESLAWGWRGLARFMPQTVTCRTPSDWFGAKIGRSYVVVENAPEVEMPVSTHGTNRVRIDESPGRDVLVLAEVRPRKNFRATVDLAVTIAEERQGRVVLCGGDEALRKMVAVRCELSRIPLTTLPRLPRAEFLRILTQERPTIVSLTLSEGVSSLFIEALAAGCEVVTYINGGTRWIAQFATAISRVPYRRHHATSMRWGCDSARRYTEFARDRLEAVMSAALCRSQDEDTAGDNSGIPSC